MRKKESRKVGNGRFLYLPQTSAAEQLCSSHAWPELRCNIFPGPIVRTPPPLPSKPIFALSKSLRRHARSPGDLPGLPTNALEHRNAPATTWKASSHTQTIRPAWGRQWRHADTLATQNQRRKRERSG
jgi:hypothetical protein